MLQEPMPVDNHLWNWETATMYTTLHTFDNSCASIIKSGFKSYTMHP